MSYTIEKGTGDIVISGFEKGIADDPYEGISNLINANITSIPKEASVNFSTAAISPPLMTNGSVTSANTGTEYFTYTGATLLENYMTVVFSSHSGLNVTDGVAYWIINLGGAGAGTFQLTTDYAQTSIFNVTSTGTGTFVVANVATDPVTGGGGGIPKFFAYDAADSAYFMLTGNGSLWSNIKTTTSGYWTYCGPSGTTVGANQGTGMAYIQSFIDPITGQYNSYIIVFRNTTIDYFYVHTGAVLNLQWVFGWTPIDGTSSHTTATLNANTAIHNAFFAQNNTLYWCDGTFLGSLFETPDGPPQTIQLDLTKPATYIYAKQALALPYLDQAQCLTQLGDNLLIGGANNIVYPWDKESISFGTEIQLPEYNVQQLITVNTNTFIFVGNRGRIYQTNGSQANLYKKVPDFLSNTIEPYFQWGGACSNKNQLYFSFTDTTNSGTNISTYGGVWAIDLDTKAMRLLNTLSYQTTVYNGFASCLIPNFSSSPAGVGIYIGWDSKVGTRGIDTTLSTPYTGNTAVANAIIDSDLIPIGTFLQPTTSGRVEFKLSVPITSGETVKIQYRQRFSDAFSDISTTTVFNFAGIATQNWTGYSGVYQNVNFQNSQWVQLRAILTSTATNPSYARLTELRLGK